MAGQGRRHHCRLHAPRRILSVPQPGTVVRRAGSNMACQDMGSTLPLCTKQKQLTKTSLHAFQLNWWQSWPSNSIDHASPSQSCRC